MSTSCACPAPRFCGRVSCATRRTFGRIFPCRGASDEATGKNYAGGGTRGGRSDRLAATIRVRWCNDSDRSPTIIVFPVASSEAPRRGKQEHEFPSRSPLHPPRGSSGRVKRRRYSAEHGTTDAAAGFLLTKLHLRGCRGTIPCSAISAFCTGCRTTSSCYCRQLRR